MKLHLIVDPAGNLMRVNLTPGNVDDRAVVEPLTHGLLGVLFADKGYISQELFLRLYQRGLKLVTGIKKNMKNILLPLQEKRLLRKRSLIETVFDDLKNKFQLEHTRHRSPFNAFIHILTTLIAYQLKPTKPSIASPFQITNPSFGFKGKTSRKLLQEFEVLRKRYWGQPLWASGYFAVTVGNVNSEDIQRYIENQKEHHKKDDFRISEF